MKNFRLFLALLVCFSVNNIIISQSAGFKIKKIDFSSGQEFDRIKNLGADYFLNQIPNVQKSNVNDLNIQTRDINSMSCENPSINLGLTLVHPSIKNIEWRNALAYKHNRIDAVSYYRINGDRNNYINISGNHSEFTLESALIYKVRVFNFFNLYGGLGTNLGVTTNNNISVTTANDLTLPEESSGDQIQTTTWNHSERFNEHFNTGSQLNQRVFVQIGTGIKFFQRIEIGTAIKYGYGYRADIGNTINVTNMIATNWSIRYILN